MALHQQAAKQLEGDDLGGAGKEELEEGWKGLGSYGSGLRESNSLIYNATSSPPAMKYLFAVAALTTAANTFLTSTMAITAGDFFPEKCIIASKPTKCRVNSFGVTRNPKNDFEIYYPGGLAGIRFGKSGTKQGATAYINNIPGTIQLSHGGEGSAALTIITKDGRIYSFTYGD